MYLFVFRQLALDARNYSVSEATNGNLILVRPYACGNICVCFDKCCNNPVGATAHYTDEEQRLADLVVEEQRKVNLDILFSVSV